MTSAEHGRPTAAGPRILALSQSEPTSTRGLLESLLADILDERRRGHEPAVCVTLDAAEADDLPGDVRGFREVLAGLVRAAFDAAVQPAPPSDVPPLCEVVVTSIDTGDALEIEIADSGCAAGHDVLHAEALAAARAFADRCGGSLAVGGCPEGGSAVTLRLPRRRAMSRAA